MFSYVPHYGNHKGPHARGRARVTMVTRLCARVERSVWFRIDKSPCLLGNPNEPLAVTDWISKLTWVLLHFLYYGNHGGPHARRHARVTVVTRLCARVEHSVWFKIPKSQCWPGNSSGPLAVTRWISKLTCVFLCPSLWKPQRAPRAGTRAGDHGHPPVCARRAFCMV